ncbi:hypothetical protein KSP40_PGU006561 [Platanthera guangdongensis]|uniref:SURP motif domain-containing protein n=1 Tax=Platanthera guangdongensis TaxID=2320717 RepID=A0ABR2LE08_9ASPA
MDLEIVGRHALFFDDDATAAFVNSHDALVQCNYDASLLIDRYDVRHLLDRNPPRPTAGTRRQRLLDDACDAVSLTEIDYERYKDLPPSDQEGEDLDSETWEQSNATGSGAYQAVPFLYGDKNKAERHDNAEYSSGFHPPFEVPESLLSHLPPTEKLHQIIARTAIFVNAHGRQSEIVLRVKQGDNPTFAFLMPDHHLHVYFQYLVDHPQIVRSDTDSPKREEDKPNNHFSESGALSLLGSVYGTGDDDESTLRKEIKEMEPLNLSSAPIDSEHGEPSSIVLGNDESGKHPFSTDAKEKSTSAMKKISGNVTTIAGSRKEGNDCGHSLSAEKTHNSQEDTACLKPSILEPPSFLKRTIEKAVEFIVRNGKQFEAILVDQDRNIGRFPFLLSTNQYHSYYLQILDEAQELKVQGKNLFDQKNDKEQHGGSKKMVESHAKDANINNVEVELSERGHYDVGKDKFKMILGGPKKDSPDQHPKAAKHSGLSADEAAAIVLAATKGETPVNSVPRKSADDGIPQLSKTSGATTEEAAAIVMFATRGRSPANASAKFPSDDVRTSSLGSLQESKSVSRFASNGISASTGLSGSTVISSDVAVATAIAKTAAIAASREADSSDASLTKEQKLKAERLKRAKMFAALIKTGGNCAGELWTSSGNRDGSMEPPIGESTQFGTDSNTLGREREGSSVPFGVEGSDTEHASKKKHSLRSRAHHNDSDEDVKPIKKKHHSSRHKQHSSTDDEHYERRYGKSSDYRRRRRHRAHQRSSEDEDVELYERRWRKLRSRSERRRESEAGDAQNSIDSSKGPSVSVPRVSVTRDVSASDDGKSSDAAEIPNDLRAKIRAMLLETM